MSNDYNGKKRSELPDSVFGIPQERKYPMPDEKHTRSAIKLFNHVDPKYEEQLAKAVIKNMKKYGIDGSVVGPNNRLRKYLPKDMIKESVINEGYFRSTDNLEFNLNKWSKSGNHNLLYITGISGSGKTTLAKEMCKKYKAEYIELDKFTLGIVKGLDRWFENVNNGTYEVHPLLKEYFSQLDHLTTNGSWSKPDMGNEHDKFLTWLIRKVKGNGTLYIVEGAQFFMRLSNMDPDLIKGEPLIVVGTSAFKSWIRRIKRDTANDETISRFIYHLKKDVPMLFKYYFSNEKDLQKYIKNMQSNVNESYLLQEASIPEEIPNDIRELLRRLNSYDYGYIKNGQKIKGTKNFFEDYKSLTISEFEKYQIGVCWDYVHYEAYWFAKNKYKYETFYIQVQDEDNDCPSHTYLVFYLPNSSKVYYFESSWGKYQGIEAFDNIIKLHNTIKERHIESAKSKCDPKTYFRNKYDAKSSRWEHLSCGDYMVKVSNGKVQVNESLPILPQNTGITTVIFDIGDVLVSANIKDYLVADPEVPNEIVDELLKLWFIEKDEVDDTMDLDTYREIVNKRMGTEFSKYIPKLFRYNVECVTAFDYTIPMIQDLKDKGYKVYYLSNWSAWTHDLLQEAGKFDFLKLMDGGVFSYDVGYMKPNEEIYKILLNKYKINPEEAIFFDDREENIEAANKLGIHGIHFPRHDSSIVYNNLYGRKLAKAIYEDMDNLRYDFGPGRELEATYKLFLETNSMAINLQYEASKELMKIIKPVILEDKEFKNRAKELHLTLKCKLLPVKGSIISVLVLDGSQEYRDTPDARKLLNDIRASCIMIINKLSGLLKKYISKIDIGDGDEGCLYFHLNKIKAIVHDLKNKVVKEEEMDFPNIPIIFEDLSSDTPQINIQESIQEYGTTGGTIVGANQPDSVYIVNYMQNNVFSGYKEPKQAICKKGMNQMYTTKNGKAIPVDIDKFKEEASDVSVFRFKETPVLSFDKIIENASVDGDFYMLLTGDYPTNQHEIEYDNRFVQEENFLDELDDITCCTESTITGQIETSNYPYMKVLTESVQGRCWNYYRDINGVFAMNELTGLRTPSYENAIDIPRSQIKLIERGTVYLGE